MRTFLTPFTVNVDAYQAGHFEMIPPGMENFQLSQAIFRKPFNPADERIISAGMAPMVKLELEQPITKEDIQEADWFYNDFHSPGLPYPWPKAMFQKIIDKFGGMLPVVVSGLYDGQTHYAGEPHAQIWTDVPEMGELVGWLESTMLPYFWTMSKVATLGRMRREKMISFIHKYYPEMTRDEVAEMCQYQFHDFGRRGGAVSQMTGIAHLMNWRGTDTVDAAYTATVHLNDRRKFGATSIRAGAHRTVTPWSRERFAYDRMIEKCKGNIFSIVIDSYGSERGYRMVSEYADVVKFAGGMLIARPDSGDPVQSILMGLRIMEKAFGATKTPFGLKKLINSAIIQGDGVDDGKIFNQIYPAIVDNGFCPMNVAFGMGENNHKAVRSEGEHAYKTALVINDKGDYVPVMKGSDDRFKKSVPGPVKINTSLNGRGRVQFATVDEVKAGETGDLKVFFDGRGRLPIFRELFSETRERAYRSWDEHGPQIGDTFDLKIREAQDEYLEKRVAEAMADVG